MAKESLKNLLVEIRDCRHCQNLPFGPRPILSAAGSSKILIIGQAPGIRVHESGKAWNDASGRRLREWMDVDENTFYDAANCAIVPMGFCYPGTGGESGDLPPRKECATLWHDRLLSQLDAVELTLLLGQYAHRFKLKDRRKHNLTETVRSWQEYTPKFLPLPHPSPRNNRWLKKNPWFESELLPWLKKRVKRLVEG